MTYEISGKDFSEITIKDDIKDECFDKCYGFRQDVALRNLGIYKNDKNGSYRTDRFAGVLPLVDGDGKPVNKDNDNYYIAINARWGDPVKMLETVFQSTQATDEGIAEFLKPKIKKWEEWDGCNFNDRDQKVLYGVVSDWPQIELQTHGEDGGNKTALIPDIQNFFEIFLFIEQLKKICRQVLKQQSVPFEENLVGKLKGRLNINKQIKYNLAKGRADRNYCIYNKMSIDILENRILKYALHICKIWSNRKGNIFSEDIFFCDNALRPVKLTRITKADIRSVKCNNAYKDYKKAIDLAARLLERLEVKFEEKEKPSVATKKVIPFFIRMDLLFELYCRAIVEESLAKFNSKLSLKKYGDNKMVFVDDDIPKGFQNMHIPDIVIEEEKQVKYIIDAKYRYLDTPNGDRDRNREITHQILSYMLLYNAEQCGFMFPSSSGDEVITRSMSFNKKKKGFSYALNWQVEKRNIIESLTEQNNK